MCTHAFDILLDAVVHNHLTLVSIAIVHEFDAFMYPSNLALSCKDRMLHE